MNILIILLIAFLLIAPPAICEDDKVIVSYPTKEGVYYTESQPNVFQLKRSGDYEVLAYIKPVTEKKKRIFNAHEVDLTKLLKKKGPPLKTEITNEGLLILNRLKEGHLAKDEIKFNIPLPEQGISIEEYPLFQIAYKELNPLAPLGIRIRFDLDTDEDGEIDTTAFAKVPEAISGKLVKSIDFSKVDLIPKPYFYILYRKLGIKTDEKWRYAQDGENVVIQRRFYENLREVPVIKLFFDRKSKVNRINFMVDFNNNEIPDATIEFERTIYRSFSKGELQGIEVNLLESVKRIFPKKEKIYLTEIFIFAEGNKDSILRLMPLKRLGFYQTGIKEMGKLLLVEEDQKEEGVEQKCLTVDLSKIEKEGIYSARIKRTDIALEFWKDTPSGAVFKKMVFCDAMEEETPLVLNAIKSFVRKFGIQTDASEEIILIPEIKLWEDFSMLSENIKGWSIKGINSSDIYIENSSTGLKITYKGKNFPTLTLQKDTNFKIDENTYFQCDYQGEGIKAYLNLKWWDKGKEKETKFVLSPYIPIRIDDKIKDKKNITKMSIILTSSGGYNQFFKKYWSFGLKKILCFRIIPVQETDFLNTYTPTSEIATPLLFNEVSPSSREILVWREKNTANIVWHAFSASPLNLSLRCLVNKKNQDMSFLSFGYKIDPDLPKLNPFWLKIIIDLENNKHKTKRIVSNTYLNKDEAWINLPLRENSGIIKNIDFNINIEKIPAFKPYLFEIRDVYVSKTYIASLISELLGKGILAKIDNYKIKAQDVLEILYKGQNAKDNFLNGGTWVSLGKFFFFEGEHEVEFATHEYLKIDALLLRGETPISAVLMPSGTPKEPLSERVLGWGLKTIFLGFVFFCLYLIYRFGRLYLPVWNKFDKVWSLVPIWTKVVIFPALGLCLYALGLKKKVGQSANYLFTLGSIFLVLGYHYLSLLLKPWWLKHHEGISAFIYRSSGSVYIIGFMTTLIIAAFFLVFGIEPVAEQAAVIGYYLLVVGVIKEFLAFRKSA